MGDLANTLEYHSFRSTIPLKKIVVDDDHHKAWSLYEAGPRNVRCPLIFFPPASGSADVFFKQILALSTVGYRVIAVDYPVYWTLKEICDGFQKLLDHLHLDKVHIFGASLGGFIAQKFAEHTSHSPRVMSLLLCNSFNDTSIFQQTSAAPTFWMMPALFLKKMVIGSFQKGMVDSSIADSIDFLVDKLDGLSQKVLASRLTLNCMSSYVEPQKLHSVDITIMDVFDECALSQLVKDEMYKCYPNAKRAHLKSGGNFPYLSRSLEVNVFIQVHLQKYEGTKFSAKEESDPTDIIPVDNKVYYKNNQNEDDNKEDNAKLNDFNEDDNKEDNAKLNDFNEDDNKEDNAKLNDLNEDDNKEDNAKINDLNEDDNKEDNAKINDFNEDDNKEDNAKINDLNEDDNKEDNAKLNDLNEDDNKEDNAKINDFNEDDNKEDNAKINDLNEDDNKEDNAKINDLNEDDNKEDNAKINDFNEDDNKEDNAKINDLNEDDDKEDNAKINDLNEDDNKEDNAKLNDFNEDDNKEDNAKLNDFNEDDNKEDNAKINDLNEDDDKEDNAKINDLNEDDNKEDNAKLNDFNDDDNKEDNAKINDFNDEEEELPVDNNTDSNSISAVTNNAHNQSATES